MSPKVEYTSVELSPLNNNNNSRQIDDFSGPIKPSSTNKLLLSASALPQSPNTPQPPVDKWNIVWIVLFLHGIGILIPWNMFINSADYFTGYKLNRTLIEMPYKNVTEKPFTESDLDKVDEYSKNFLSYIGAASQTPNLVFAALNLFINMGSGNLRTRVNLTLVINALVFVLTILLANINTNTWPCTFFYITMASVAVINMSNGVYQNCIFGTGAQLSGHFINAIMIGSNMSGTFTSLTDILSAWLSPQPQEAAIYYFCTALFVILICLVTYNLLPYNAFYRYMNDNGNRQKQVVIKSIKKTSDNQNDNSDWVPDSIKNESLLNNHDEINIRDDISNDDNDDSNDNDNETNTCLSELSLKWQVFKKCWPQCLNVFLCFFLTISVFPPILRDVKQVQEHSLGLSKEFFPRFACYLAFNLFAMIGNLISNFTTWPGPRHLWIIVWLRVIFVPFFLFCNFRPETRKWPVYIRYDSIFLFGNILMAISSGYISSLSMMFTSQGLPSNEAQRAGMIAAFFLVFGIFTGIYTSFFYSYLVENVNLMQI